MRRFSAGIVAVVFALAAPAWAQDTIELTVAAGRPLRVALDRRVRIKEVGQPIAGTVVQPVYAYDRIVVPVGTHVLGRVIAIDPLSKMTRLRATLAGDLTPAHHVELEFDRLSFADGRTVAMRTAVGSGTENLTLSIAETPGKTGIVAEARARIAERAGATIAAVKAPGRMERLRDAVMRRLPYHPQALARGTVYSARLLTPLQFGAAEPIGAAPPGTKPAPESILNARFATPIDSATAERGMPIEAVLTRPVFSADHLVVLPEGTRLEGEVTFAKRARRFHRNGQLRFLIESVRVPNEDPHVMLASLYSVEMSEDAHVAVDEEGGARVTNQKSRFVAPALALLALRGTIHRHHHDYDGDADDVPGAAQTGSRNVGSRGVGGFFGWGLAGAALGQISRPVGIAFSAVGAARTVYSSVFGKGSEVSFPVDTPIQVQLAPAAAK